MRTISIEGLELIGKGGTGEVYRINDEQILKLYHHITPEQLQEQKNTAREIFKAGVPTAISFETVQIGERYGIIYELVRSQTVGKDLREHPEEVDDVGRRMAALLKTCHSCRPESVRLERMNDRVRAWIDRTEAMGLYAPRDIAALREIADAIPDADTVLHCDFHEGNVLTQNGEYLLIDVDDMCVGHPIYDLTFHYMNHDLISHKPELLMNSAGLTPQLAKQVAEITRACYFEGVSAERKQCCRRIIKKLMPFLCALAAGRLGDEHDYLDRKNTLLMKHIFMRMARLTRKSVIRDLRLLAQLEGEKA